MAAPDLPIALCAGDVSEELVALLGDVLAEVQLRVCTALPAGRVASLVLVGVGSRELALAVAAARRSAGAVPLVVLLPIQDRRLSAAAFRGGADGCYALGTPLARLRILVARLLISHWTRGRARPAPPGAA